jgi:hypothetical protein
MKRFFHHENTKFWKHETYLNYLFRVLVLSCFRDYFIVFVSACWGWSLRE